MIVCCGEALIDMLPRLTAEGEAAFVPHVGGAVFNTAIALGRLGTKVGFFTGISTDFFGAMLRDALVESKVETRFAHISNNPTTLAFVQLFDGQASYAFFDENSAGRMLLEKDMPVIDDGVEAMHFSCISLIPEPGGSTYESLMLREHGKRVMMLDPNIRKDFIPDKASHMARLRRMIALADIVKLSDEDLAWFGETGTDTEIARRWLTMGPKLVAITHGSKGAKGYTDRFEISVPAPAVTVADTVGAGDTFNAGILASLSRMGLLTKDAISRLTEEDVTEALAFAARIAAVTVSRAGANPPWAHELS